MASPGETAARLRAAQVRPLLSSAPARQWVPYYPYANPSVAADAVAKLAAGQMPGLTDFGPLATRTLHSAPEVIEVQVRRHRGSAPTGAGQARSSAPSRAAENSPLSLDNDPLRQAVQGAEPGEWVTVPGGFSSYESAARFFDGSGHSAALHALDHLVVKAEAKDPSYQLFVRRHDPQTDRTPLFESLAGARPGTWIIESQQDNRNSAYLAAYRLRRQPALHDLGSLETRARTIGDNTEVHIRRAPPRATGSGTPTRR